MVGNESGLGGITELSLFFVKFATRFGGCDILHMPHNMTNRV